MRRSNCPNCNGILSYEGGLHCDYCGAWFERPRRTTVRSWEGDAFYADDGIYRVRADYIRTGKIVYGCTA